MKNIADKITKALPKRTTRLLKDIGALADSMGYAAYIVGGTVRDILLGAKNIDIDITVEGDAIGLGRAVAKKIAAGIVIHKQFGTCTVAAKRGLKIDFAMARRETYAHPGAFPKVRPGSLEDDLRRRDFTINAMAVSIRRGDFGRLIDPCGGMRNLGSGQIRIMHDKSFIDDPTRIFRAFRFEKRLSFTIESRTSELIKEAIERKALEKISRNRIRKELGLMYRSII